ncbi:hypothetical protein [Chryseobacterium sp. JUb7]|uniref:hypothetical protein n=1 Tax=Chryseobacterium sp. JUb7 TaxID=2940599 RepID=UPI0021693946|nr:hypothetical protein [Chryseobacterium sp. JUb7]MCS3531743.1 hypothetical protein [Chryseobacterium sp. JUb7]
MKTKTILTVIGLVTSPTIFYSCSEDNTITEPVQEITSTIPDINTLSFKFVDGDYFANSNPFNAAANYIGNKVKAAGQNYVLTQSDLDEFYLKAQIPVDQQLKLDQVKEIIAKTISNLNTPFDTLIQQTSLSTTAKTLAKMINMQSISNLDVNSDFKSLPDYEKSIIKNLNDFKVNDEKGNYSKNVFGKTPNFIWGGMIGFGVGVAVGGLIAFPVGMVVGGAIGMIVGAVVGVFTDK